MSDLSLVWKKVSVPRYPHGGYDAQGNYPVGEPIDYVNGIKPYCPVCNTLLYRRVEHWFCPTCNDYRTEPAKEGRCG